MRVFFSCWRAVCCADRAACGRELNVKETPDGFLSHYLPFQNHWSERFLTICSSVRVFGLQLQRRHGFAELAREQNRGKRHGNHVRDGLRHINAHGLIGHKLRHDIDERNEQHELAHDGHNDRARRISERDERHLAGDLDAEKHQNAAVESKRFRRKDDEPFIRRKD